MAVGMTLVTMGMVLGDFRDGPWWPWGWTLMALGMALVTVGMGAALAPGWDPVESLFLLQQERIWDARSHLKVGNRFLP